MSEILSIHDRFCNYSLVFKGNTPDTIRWYKEAIGYVVKYAHAQSLSDLNRHTIENWILTGKLEKNWSPKTIRNRLQALSLFFDWCVDQELLEKNPTEKIPKPKLPKRLPKSLSKPDAVELLDWTRNFRYSYQFDRYRAIAIIATFLYTGVRLKELQNLKISDIDLIAKSLIVRSGKGNKDRVIPINPALIRILKDYLKDRSRMDRKCPYFFTSMREDRQMSNMVIKRLIIKLKKASGIHFSPHILRHTFATLMLQGGCDLFALSKMMGHSDIKTTTIYLSATTAHLQEQVIKHPLGF